MIVTQNPIAESHIRNETQNATYEKYGFVDVESLHLLGLNLQ